MPVGIVQEVKFNVPKKSKAGREYTVTSLKYVSDKGTAKTENVFDSADYAAVVKGLAPGDEIKVSYEKNGEYFNVTNVELVKKGNGVFPSPKTNTTSSTGKTYHEDPERQAAIIRQSRLKAGVDIVSAMLNKEVYKKAIPDLIISEVIRITKKFELYASGKEQIEILSGSITTTQVTYNEQDSMDEPTELFTGGIPE